MSSSVNGQSASVTAELGQTWVDPETGTGWTITQIDSDGGVTAEAVVERTFCDARELADLCRLDEADHG